MNIRESINLCLLAAHNGLARTTARSYETGLTSFLSFLETQNIPPTAPLLELKIEHFIYYPGYLSSHSMSKSTIGVYTSGVKYFMDWLVIRNELPISYENSLRYKMAHKAAAKKREAPLPRSPKQSTVRSLIEAAKVMDGESPIKERNIAIIEFLASSGCRCAETVGMNVKDIDLIDRSAKVTGKGSKERRVFFSPNAARAIREYWRARGFSEKNHPAFARHDKAIGEKISGLTTRTVQNVVDKIVAFAGFDKGSFTPHYFRHAFATLMLHETRNLALVQDLLGHADPGSTRVYAKVQADDLKEAHRGVYK
jgi:site-specific recombinase XerD